MRGILGEPGGVSWGGKKSKRARKKFGRKKVILLVLRLFPAPTNWSAPGSPRESQPCSQGFSLHLRWKSPGNDVEGEFICEWVRKYGRTDKGDVLLDKQHLCGVLSQWSFHVLSLYSTSFDFFFCPLRERNFKTLTSSTSRLFDCVDNLIRTERTRKKQKSKVQALPWVEVCV